MKCFVLSTALAALLLPRMARAAGEEPHVCDTAASTVAVDLGSYRGAWLVTNGDGSMLGHDGWHSCPAAPKGAEKPWESCNFSLCGLADGAYRLRFADPPSPASLSFKVRGGMIDLAATKLAAQAGNYGVDMTGSRKPVSIDLQGYTLNWSITHWPGPFLGGETHGRATHDAGHVVFAMYPGGPYELNFAGAHARMTVSEAGTLSVAASGPIAIRGNVAWLRAAPVTVTPPGPGTWTIGAVSFQGPQVLVLPAGATLAVGLDSGATQTLTMDGACHPAISAGPFKAVAAPRANPAKTCG